MAIRNDGEYSTPIPPQSRIAPLLRLLSRIDQDTRHEFPGQIMAMRAVTSGVPGRRGGLGRMPGCQEGRCDVQSGVGMASTTGSASVGFKGSRISLAKLAHNLEMRNLPTITNKEVRQ